MLEIAGIGPINAATFCVGLGTPATSRTYEVVAYAGLEDHLRQPRLRSAGTSIGTASNDYLVQVDAGIKLLVGEYLFHAIKH